MGTHDVINAGHSRKDAKDAATVSFLPYSLSLRFRPFTYMHNCLGHDSPWYTASVCTASRRWCYCFVMEIEMQKWYNREIHGDVLWYEWHFWRRKFEYTRDKTTDSKIKCRKNVRIEGKLLAFRTIVMYQNLGMTYWLLTGRLTDWLLTYWRTDIIVIIIIIIIITIIITVSVTSVSSHILPRPRIKPATSRLADRRFSNWAYRAVLGRIQSNWLFNSLKDSLIRA